jgi:hypothetical protein
MPAACASGASCDRVVTSEVTLGDTRDVPPNTAPRAWNSTRTTSLRVLSVSEITTIRLSAPRSARGKLRRSAPVTQLTDTWLPASPLLLVLYVEARLPGERRHLRLATSLYVHPLGG